MDSVIPSAPAKSTKVDFDWADPFALDNQLSSEDRLVRDTAKAYAEDKLALVSLKLFAKKRRTSPSLVKWVSWAARYYS